MNEKERSAQDYIDKAVRPTLEQFISDNCPLGTEIISIHPTPLSIIVVFDIPHNFKTVK